MPDSPYRSKLPARGLVCSRCQGPLRVTSTRRPCRGVIRRYRSCPQCGYAIVTVERCLRELRPGQWPPVA